MTNDGHVVVVAFVVYAVDTIPDPRAISQGTTKANGHADANLKEEYIVWRGSHGAHRRMELNASTNMCARFATIVYVSKEVTCFLNAV